MELGNKEFMKMVTPERYCNYLGILETLNLLHYQINEKSFSEKK